MPNKQKMQNYGYFDILYFKDRSDRDPEKFWIAIAIRSRTPTLRDADGGSKFDGG
jgi:hypothetical protein